MKHFRLLLTLLVIFAPTGSWASGWTDAKCTMFVFLGQQNSVTVLPPGNQRITSYQVSFDPATGYVTSTLDSQDLHYQGTPYWTGVWRSYTYTDANGWQPWSNTGYIQSLLGLQGAVDLPGGPTGGCPAPNPCQDKAGKYAGIYCGAEVSDRCFAGCLATPDDIPGGVEMWSPGGSCWSVRMVYTGAQCGGDGGTGPPDQPPPPPPDENCDNLKSQCSARCAGRVASVDCSSGACNCQQDDGPWVPGPPPEPQTPDPGSTNPDGTPKPAPLGPNESGTSDPGSSSDASPQLGAVIANQNAQIRQGNEIGQQIGHLGAQMDSVISNQGKLIQQGNSLQGSADRIANAVEDMRNNQRNEAYNGPLPSAGDYQYPSNLPDGTDWNENSDGSEVGKAAAEKLQQVAPAGPDIFQGSITAGGDPCVSGNLMGSEINICFNYPWMQTGYSIMRVALIALAYIQTALILRRGWGGTN